MHMDPQCIYFLEKLGIKLTSEWQVGTVQGVPVHFIWIQQQMWESPLHKGGPIMHNPVLFPFF